MNKLSNLPPGVTDRMIEEAAGVDEEEHTCSICKEKFKGYGHNPEPILRYEQRCCGECNTFLVIPARIFGLEYPAVIKALKFYNVPLPKRKISRKRG